MNIGASGSDTVAGFHLLISEQSIELNILQITPIRHLAS